MFIFTLVQMLPWMALATYEEKPAVRIIGGGPISIEQVPHMALFRPDGETFHCGASIVHEQFLITAAHCMIKGKKMTVTVGTDKAKDGGQTFEIQKVVLHPNYNTSTTNNDIAVIKLKNKLKFSDRVRPIKLAEPGITIEDNATFRVTGFGITESGRYSNQLLAVEVTHIPKEKCLLSYPDLTDQMLCAGDKEKGPCSADSGGPLVYGDKQVGVVSFTISACKSTAVYARVSALRGFIDKVISDEQ